MSYENEPYKQERDDLFNIFKRGFLTDDIDEFRSIADITRDTHKGIINIDKFDECLALINQLLIDFPMLKALGMMPDDLPNEFFAFNQLFFETFYDEIQAYIQTAKDLFPNANWY